MPQGMDLAVILCFVSYELIDGLDILSGIGSDMASDAFVAILKRNFSFLIFTFWFH